MKYLSNYIDDEMSKTFKKFGIFFAFSDKQYKEEAKKGIKYISLDGGIICPKDNAKKALKELDEVIKKGIKQDLKENTKKGVIKRELYNHEAFYTGDITSTSESLKSYEITDEEIKKVFNEERNK